MVFLQIKAHLFQFPNPLATQLTDQSVITALLVNPSMAPLPNSMVVRGTPTVHSKEEASRHDGGGGGAVAVVSVVLVPP